MKNMDRTTQAGGHILAGGRSSRMGRDKAMLEIDGVTMISRAIDLIRGVGVEPVVVGMPVEFARQTKTRVIADQWPDSGPLGGIATALRDSQEIWNLVIACDMPYLTREWLRFLLDTVRACTADAIVPMNERGVEPLCAIYHKRAEPAIRTALENGIRKVIDGLSTLKVEYVERAAWKAFDSEGLLFKNMNEPADYEEAKTRLGNRVTK